MHKVATGMDMNFTFFLTSSTLHTRKWDLREHDKGSGPPNGLRTIFSCQESAFKSQTYLVAGENMSVRQLDRSTGIQFWL